MKKSYIFIFSLFIIVLIIIAVLYYNYSVQVNKNKQFNQEYETYYEKEIYGNEVATIINKAIDSNEKNNIQKGDSGFYINNDINSINIDIKIIDNNTIYKMETIYNGGISEFVQNYGEIQFKCTKIEYNSLNKVNYLLFEQITK